VFGVVSVYVKPKKGENAGDVASFVLYSFSTRNLILASYHAINKKKEDWLDCF